MNIVEHIKMYGKPTGLNGNTWNSLAIKYGFVSGEAARSYYKRIKKTEPIGIFYDSDGVQRFGPLGWDMSRIDAVTYNNDVKQKPDIVPSVYAPEKETKALVQSEPTLESLIDIWRINKPHQSPEKWQPLPLDTVLVIPDLHIPAHHKDALEFCKSLRDKYKATKVIFIGDIVDNYCTSLHSKDPNFNMTAGQEIEVTKMYLKEWHDAFPYATVITGNHDMSRIFKTAKEAMIPKQWIKDIKDVLDTPTWTYTPELVYQGIYYNHGEKAEASKVAIYKGMSTVQGHLHTKSYVQWVRKDIFACQVGTLVDRDSMVFDYAKNTYLDWWNGACIIQDGIPTLIPIK